MLQRSVCIGRLRVCERGTQLHVGDRAIVDNRVGVNQHGVVDKESVRRGDGRYRRRYSRRRFVWERLTGISVVRPSFIFRM
jgi:hypothetical protein